MGIQSSIRDGCVRIMDAIADPDLPLLVSSYLTWVTEALGAVSPDRKRPDLYDETSTYAHVPGRVALLLRQPVGRPGRLDRPNWDEMPDVRSRF